MRRIHRIPASALILGAGLALLSGCDTKESSPVASPSANTASPVGSGLARIAGTVRDSNGNVVSSARIHVYRGTNDSVPDTTFSSQTDGKFQIDLAPGKIRLFADKDGNAAQSIDFSSLQANKTTQVDSLRLSKVLTGAFKVPGVTGSSFSVRIDGSPLEASVSNLGNVSVKVIDGQESILTLSFSPSTGKAQVYRWRITANRGVLRFESISNVSVDTATPPPPVASNETLTIHPSSDDWAETGLIGSLAGGTGSRWQNINFGSRLEEALGGAYDGNTVGRLLWKYNFPDSLKNRRILSAKLVFTTLYWGIRPTGGQDYIVEGYRMLKPWKEGHGPGQEGLIVSTDNDGASATGPSYGKTWNKPMAGLDGVDAESLSVARGTLSYNSLAPINLDITEAVKGWVANPASNNGLIFRSAHESDGLYLDYPGVASDDYTDATKRPYLVLELAPANSDSSIHTAVIQPGPEGQDDACVIGTFTGTGSHDGNTQGADPFQSLGGSWDYNTVGRLLWKINLPDSLKNKTIVSAQAVFKVREWLTRPLGGHDYKVEAYRMLRSWNEGTGDFPGAPNNATLNGISSLGPRFGESWNTILVGFDGVDAETTRSAYARLPWNDTTSLSFDFTSLAKFWLTNPDKNFGVIFRSLEELDPSFPNFPGFHMSEAANPLARPKIVIQYK